MFNNWIQLKGHNYNGLNVNEVKCPFCNYKETYSFNNVPKTCYVCDAKLKLQEV